MAFSLFRKRKPAEAVKEEQVDFGQIIAQLTGLSKSAQMTFLYRYIQTFNGAMALSTSRYADWKLRELKRMGHDTPDQSRTEDTAWADLPDTGDQGNRVSTKGIAPGGNGIHAETVPGRKRTRKGVAGKVPGTKDVSCDRP